MSDIRELIERLETAAGPSRELDAEIAVALHVSAHDDPLVAHRCGCDSVYTSSLDAAASLAPEGWIWDVTSTGTAWALPPDLNTENQTFGSAAMPAIALCMALLRARFPEAQS